MTSSHAFSELLLESRRYQELYNGKKANDIFCRDGVIVICNKDSYPSLPKIFEKISAKKLDSYKRKSTYE